MSDISKKYQNPAFVAFDEYVHDDPTGTILSKLDLNGKTILDVGCGYGSYLEFLNPTWTHLTLLDKSPVMLEHAQEKAQNLSLSNVTFLQAEAEHLPFPSEHFDTVMTTFALCECTEPERVIDELFRVLKKNGELIIIDSIGGNTCALYDLVQIGDVLSNVPIERESAQIWAYLLTLLPKHTLLDHLTYTVRYVYQSLEEAEHYMPGMEPRISTNEHIKKAIHAYLLRQQRNGKIVLATDTLYLRIRK